MTLHRLSPCKVNFILNILRKRSDGFHELETLMHPIPLTDELTVGTRAHGIHLTCNHAELPTDHGNLVYRAADAFLKTAGLTDGVEIHLQKNVPLAAGLGGGSSNAAHTLRALAELFPSALTAEQLYAIAATLGSDVPFFLQDGPALAVGRGEQIQPLPPSRALRDNYILLIHPGFGVSTPWAYQKLADHPQALHGTEGRAAKLAGALQISLPEAAPHFYNSLEAPVLGKFPILKLYQLFLMEQGAGVALMSGSGSTTFALFHDEAIGRKALAEFPARFGASAWTSLVKLMP